MCATSLLLTLKAGTCLTASAAGKSGTPAIFSGKVTGSRPCSMVCQIESTKGCHCDTSDHPDSPLARLFWPLESTWPALPGKPPEGATPPQAKMTCSNLVAAVPAGADWRSLATDHVRLADGSLPAELREGGHTGCHERPLHSRQQSLLSDTYNRQGGRSAGTLPSYYMVLVLSWILSKTPSSVATSAAGIGLSRSACSISVACSTSPCLHCHFAAGSAQMQAASMPW